MAQAAGYSRQSRIASAAAAAAVHAALGLALVAGLGFRPPPDGAADPLKIFDLARPAPPPEVPEPEPELPQTRQAEPAAPAAPAGQASPVVAPVPEVRLDPPPPVTAAPLPQLGTAALPGTSPLPGPGGSGSGGEGQGSGAGGRGAGSGSGGGGPAVRTRRISGGFTNADYPRAAERAGAQGRVVARLTVGSDGRVSDCRVRISSGHEALDATTCRLIQIRFRFQPARNAEGSAIAETVEWEQVWSLQPEGDPRAAEAVCRGRADALPRAARRDGFMSCMAEYGWTR